MMLSRPALSRFIALARSAEAIAAPAVSILIFPWIQNIDVRSPTAY
jgi:hypothetical protein